MTAGLPGIGIGGIFYLFCAFAMPFIELANTFRGKSSVKRWKIVGLQFNFAATIVGCFWLVGLGLGKIVSTPTSTAILATRHQNMFHVQSLWLSLFILFMVLLGLQIVNFTLDFKWARVFRLIRMIRIPRLIWGR